MLHFFIYFSFVRVALLWIVGYWIGQGRSSPLVAPSPVYTQLHPYPQEACCPPLPRLSVLPGLVFKPLRPFLSAMRSSTQCFLLACVNQRSCYTLPTQCFVLTLEKIFQFLTQPTYQCVSKVRRGRNQSAETYGTFPISGQCQTFFQKARLSRCKWLLQTPCVVLIIVN